MNKPENKFNWMPILRTGIFTDKNNQTVTIDEAALDKIITATDCTKEPQFVVEHPKFDEIGFGTIEQIKKIPSRDGKEWVLFALPKKVEEKFKQAVNSGKLPGRSVTLEKATYALKNISFLPPDVPPAVPGLGAYSFAEGKEQSAERVPLIKGGIPQSGRGDAEALNLQLSIPGNESHFADLESSDYQLAIYDVSSYPFKTIQAIFRNIKNFIIGEKSVEVADQMIPEFYLSEVGTPPALIENKNPAGIVPSWEGSGGGSTDENLSLNNGDNMSNEEKSPTSRGTIDLSKLDLSNSAAAGEVKAAIEFLQAENTKLTTDLAAKNVELQAANKKLTAAETEKLRNEVIQFCDGEAKKKIKPADREKVINFLMAQSAGSFGKEEGVIEFQSAGAGEKVQLNAYEFAQGLIKTLPDFVTDSEIATGANAGVKDVDNAELMAQKALEFQAAELKEGRSVSASAAVAHVKKGLSN